jgi:predicted membrane-bound mannosyltransferase
MLRGSERGPRAARAVMTLALVLGLTRFWRLGEWGLWVDEAHTLHDAMWLLPGSPPDYPLGYIAVRAMIELCGGSTSEAVLRFVPALCGFLSIPLCAWALMPALGIGLYGWHNELPFALFAALLVVLGVVGRRGLAG